MILFVESIWFLGRIINQFRSKEICFHFLFINFMVFTIIHNNSISLSQDAIIQTLYHFIHCKEIHMSGLIMQIKIKL